MEGFLFENMDKKIYLTKEGLEDLKKEYEALTKIKRPDILAQVTQARNMGDLSENAEYAAAREELSFIDGRIDELEELIKQATLIQEHTGKGNSKGTIDLGSVVAVNVGKNKETFTVVGEWEADPQAKKISHESPLGKALLGKKVGDEVEVEAPSGKILYSIVSVH